MIKGEKVIRTKSKTRRCKKWISFWKDFDYQSYALHIQFRKQSFESFVSLEDLNSKVWQLHERFFHESEVLDLVNHNHSSLKNRRLKS